MTSHPQSLLHGRTAVVTGAGAGIGKGVALALAGAGVRVIAAGRSANIEQTASEAEGITSFRCDVADAAQVSALEAHAREMFGGIDTFVANAAVAGVLAPMHEIDVQSLDTAIAVNVRGTFLCVQAALRLMLESGGGSVVVVGSIGGMRPVPGAAAYGMSKAATHTMVRHAALEYGKHGIRVNAVAPGATDTDLLAQASDEIRARVTGSIPLGRIATVEQIARIVLMLAADTTDHVTGQTWVVDGGTTIFV